MRYVELRCFPDPSLVTGGFTHFVWAVADNTQLPQFHEEFGTAIVLADTDPIPATYSRYNPTTRQFASPAVEDPKSPTVDAYKLADWDNSATKWRPKVPDAK